MVVWYIYLKIKNIYLKIYVKINIDEKIYIILFKN